MTRIEFTEEKIEKLRYERFHHPHPRVQLKMEALLLKSQGVPHWKICNILAITENTLRAYLCAYLEGGVEKRRWQRSNNSPASDAARHKSAAGTMSCYYQILAPDVLPGNRHFCGYFF